MPTNASLLDKIRKSVIGDDRVFDGPFGARRITYADYTASGRSLDFIEDFLRDRVLPYYANTHSEASLTGLQTTRYREQARAQIHRSIGANDKYAIIFCGSGATGAINRLIDILNIRIPANLDAKYALSKAIPAGERPVVFIGPYEHHSNELPWRETIAEVVAINEDADGRIDLKHLEQQLRLYQDRKLLIGSFSAASNVTGIISDMHAISNLLHAHNALSFWDYAAAAPYMAIDVSGGDASPSMDALFISPHKFVGGPGSPGVLVVHKRLMDNRVPARPGGGTVSYVNPIEHVYITDQEHREEGGTPAIIESIRAGLVFQLKDRVGVDLIEARETAFVRRALKAWSANPNIHVLGNPELPRLSIISFIIRYGKQNLHHDFVVALLNDLFGIQSRGGCSCAGPYGHRLLHIGLDQSHAFEESIVHGCIGIKPGWARIGFNYFFSDTVVDYIIEAIDLIAEHGWKLLPFYTFDLETGLWRHRKAADVAPAVLDNMDIFNPVASTTATIGEEALAGYLEEARRTFAQMQCAKTMPACTKEPFSCEAEALRWFPLPEEIREKLLAK
ncbi:Cysteine desulfurase [hydrothermal vent metagenome]|uniref:Cysteine desulfurase n=1 Tax=hydrothermal vent metagenome TaxID=652676 RepID=A0A3B0T3D6_9ZZZZ